MEKIMVEEWVGLKIKIIGSPNPNIIGMEGEVIGESQNAVKILCNGKMKIVPKKGASALVLGTEKIIRLGDALVRPEERSRKLYSKIKK